MRRSGLIALSVAGSLTLHAFGVVTINEYNSDKQLIGTRTIGTSDTGIALDRFTQYVDILPADDNTRIEPGQIVPLHTHRWPAAYYVLSVGDFVRRDEHGRVTLDTRATPTGLRPGTAVWSPALGPHTLENVGATTIHVVSVEVKHAVATSTPLER